MRLDVTEDQYFCGEPERATRAIGKNFGKSMLGYIACLLSSTEFLSVDP